MSKFNLSLSMALVAVASLAACGGGDADPAAPAPAPEPAPAPAPAPTNQLETLTVPGYPHQVTVYRAAGATRAVVFLHGGGGSTDSVAYQLGLKSTLAAPTVDNVAWAPLVASGVIAVFPQGQAITSDSNANTWSNYTMSSGQDDLAFLKALSTMLRTRYGIGNVALAGHSMGGAMVNRVRCEASGSFQSYVSFSGPASVHFQGADSCAAGAQAPYAGFFGSADPVIQGAWEAQTWTVSALVQGLSPAAFVNPLMLGEWLSFQYRAKLMCGETPSLPAQTPVGGAAHWQACGGRLQESLAAGAGHGIDSIAGVIGSSPFALVADFTAR